MYNSSFYPTPENIAHAMLTSLSYLSLYNLQ